jgi:hypothetical protein
MVTRKNIKTVKRKRLKIKWKNEDAIAQYYLLKKKYGTPSNQDLNSGGIAIWNEKKLKGTCFSRIEILDESIPHCVPMPHRDFLYTYVNYEVPDDKVLDVISLSGSVAYDPLKKYLRARCATESANIATLYLAVSIGNSKVTLKQVQKNELYKKAILSLSNDQNIQLYNRILCKMLKEQPGNPDWSGSFGLSFPEGCCDGYDPEKNTCGKDEKIKEVNKSKEKVHIGGDKGHDGGDKGHDGGDKGHGGDKSDKGGGYKGYSGGDKADKGGGSDKSDKSKLKNSNLEPIIF